MKLIKKDVNSEGLGTIKIQPEGDEDMWHLYNIIRVGDSVTATTFRKVNMAESAMDIRGSPTSQRVKLVLQVSVEAIEYDGEAAEMRLRGRVMNEASEHVRVGSYHTLTIAQSRPLTISKQEVPGWDAFALDIIKRACSEEAIIGTADLAVLLVDEGYAALYLIGGEGLSLKRAKIETRIPKKFGAAAAGIERAHAKFYNRCALAIAQHIDFDKVQCLVLAGPGFTKDELKKYLLLEASRAKGSSDDSNSNGSSLAVLLENKSKIVTAHASSAYGHALQETLKAPEISKRIQTTKAASQIQSLDRFYKMLGHDETRAFYGPVHVDAAAEVGAIEELLITDTLFRNPNAQVRMKYTKLVESIKELGGKVQIFSSMHVSGEQLDQMTGIAAILRFPMPELEDIEVEAS